VTSKFYVIYVISMEQKQRQSTLLIKEGHITCKEREGRRAGGLVYQRGGSERG